LILKFLFGIDAETEVQKLSARFSKRYQTDILRWKQNFYGTNSINTFNKNDPSKMILPSFRTKTLQQYFLLQPDTARIFPLFE